MRFGPEHFPRRLRLTGGPNGSWFQERRHQLFAVCKRSESGTSEADVLPNATAAVSTVVWNLTERLQLSARGSVCCQVLFWFFVSKLRVSNCGDCGRVGDEGKRWEAKTTGNGD